MRRRLELTGNKYGKLLVIKYKYLNKKGHTVWECKCDCGKMHEVIGSYLVAGRVKSCGCTLQPDLVGRRYGKLVVKRFIGVSERRKSLWECLCDCGKLTIAKGTSLRAGLTCSCGCAAGFQETHGKSRTREYAAWSDMKSRCLNINNKAYKYYGARGIKICKRWLHSFSNFYDDMGKRPDNYSIERVDNDGNYTPKNCEWIPLSEQPSNRRNTMRN